MVDSIRESVTIEPASWWDLNAVRHLEQVCFPKDAWPLWDLIGVLSFPKVVRLKAVAGGRLVGFIGVDIREREDIAWIATVGVLPEYPRKGIGRALLEASERQLNGIGRIRLSVRMSNEAAIRLYEQQGYQRVGVWKGYYSEGEDGLVMEKNLR